MPEKKLSVIFMGTPDFAVAPLLALINDKNITVSAVVTRQDKKTGREQLLTPPPVKELALQHNIAVLQPETLKNNRDFFKLLKDMHPDFIVVTAFGKILTPEILAIPRYGCINIHGSILPKYRGASPVEEALLHGDTHTGITFMKMSEEMDAGDILLAQRLHIDPSDNALTLRKKLSLFAASALTFLLKDIVEGEIRPIPQNHSAATYCHKISKEDGLINLAGFTAEEICNRIRAFTPWPSVFLSVDGKIFKILEAGHDPENSQKPGRVVDLPDGFIGLGTGKGLLILKKVQLEGKKPMSIQEFSKGNRVFFKKIETSAMT